MSAVPEMAPPPWAYRMAVLLPGEEPRLLGVCTYTCRSKKCRQWINKLEYQIL